MKININLFYTLSLKGIFVIDLLVFVWKINSCCRILKKLLDDAVSKQLLKQERNDDAPHQCYLDVVAVDVPS